MCKNCSKGGPCFACIERGGRTKPQRSRVTTRELPRPVGLSLPRLVREMVPVRAEVML